jgi:lactate dehydrogenase-like 2-hydroxyacid dehydrogenase
MTSLTKIAILDDYQNASEKHFQHFDRSKFEIASYPETLLPYNHPDTPEDVKQQLVERLKPYTIICCMRERTPFPGDLLRQLPNLKLLLSTGKRNLSLDLPACQELGITVAGTGQLSRSDKPKPAHAGEGPDSTTQHCVALILGLARNLAEDDKNVKAGGWQTAFATGLSGKTLGVLGLGRLGVSTAKIMHQAFGMRILAWSSNLTQEVADQKAEAAGLGVTDEDGEKIFKVVSKDELFSTADVVSVHYVLGPRSRGIVAKSDLDKMKPSALFINTSRGPLVVEEDLLEILEKGKIRGAALDVFEFEPLKKDSKWRTDKWGKGGRSTVLLSPHMGYVEEEVLGNWYEENAENVVRWVEGRELTNYLI